MKYLQIYGKWAAKILNERRVEVKKLIMKIYRHFFPDWMEGKGECINKDIDIEALKDLFQKMSHFLKYARRVRAQNHGSG